MLRLCGCFLCDLRWLPGGREACSERKREPILSRVNCCKQEAGVAPVQAKRGAPAIGMVAWAVEMCTR